MLSVVRASVRRLTASEKATLAGLLIFRVLLNLADVLGVLALGVLVGRIVDSDLTYADAAPAFGILERFLDLDIRILSGGLAIYFLAKNLAAVFHTAMVGNFFARLSARRSAKLLKDLLAAKNRMISSGSEGDLQWALGVSSYVAFNSVLFTASTVLTEAFVLAGIGVSLFLLEPRIASALIIYFGLILVLFHFSVGRRLERLGERISKSSVESNNVVLEAIRASREVLVYGKVDLVLKRFNSARSLYAKDQASQRLIFSIPRLIVEIALVFALVGGIFLVEVSDTSPISLGSLSLVAIMGVRAAAAGLPIQGAVAELRANTPQAKRAHRLLDDVSLSQEKGNNAASLRSKMKSKHSDIRDRHIGPSVELKNVTFSYANSSQPLFHDVSLRIEGGKLTAVIGSSGAGKTTLADLILGLLEPSSGKVLIDGVEPSDLAGSSQELLAYVPQRPSVIAGTFLENVCLEKAVSSLEKARAISALERSGLGDMIRALPQGYETVIGTKSEEMSGGQLQRLGIARALFHDARLMVLDEPTSALDATTEAEVMSTIRALIGERTILIIAHRLSSVLDADYVLHIEKSVVTTYAGFGEAKKSRKVFGFLSNLGLEIGD